VFDVEHFGHDTASVPLAALASAQRRGSWPIRSGHKVAGGGRPIIGIHPQEAVFAGRNVVTAMVNETARTDRWTDRRGKWAPAPSRRGALTVQSTPAACLARALDGRACPH
jgi:hypothetical protein